MCASVAYPGIVLKSSTSLVALALVIIHLKAYDQQLNNQEL